MDKKAIKAWAILNSKAEFWSPRAFPNELEAKRYWMQFWRKKYFDDKSFSVVPVEIHLLPTTGCKKESKDETLS